MHAASSWLVRLLLLTGALLAPLSFASAGVASSTDEVAATRYHNRVFDSVSVQRDLVYGAAIDENGAKVPLTLDLYRPVGDRLSARPAVVWAHGGGFVTGDKGWPNDVAVATDLARRGWVVVSVNYRLRAKVLPLVGQLPAARDAKHDVQAAIRWLRARATMYRIEPRAIAATGASAGGIAALHAGLSPEDPGASGNPGLSSSVAAAAGVSAFVAVPTLIGGSEPPIALVHAADDTAIPMPLAATTCLLTRALSNHCTLHLYPTGGHPPGFLTAHFDPIMRQLSTFLCRRAVPDCK